MNESFTSMICCSDAPLGTVTVNDVLVTVETTPFTGPNQTCSDVVLVPKLLPCITIEFPGVAAIGFMVLITGCCANNAVVTVKKKKNGKCLIFFISKFRLIIKVISADGTSHL